MKLVRANCPCGFLSNKVRWGFHFFQWWFPVYRAREKMMSEEFFRLPATDQSRFDDASSRLFTATAGNQSRTQISEQLRMLRNDQIQAFVNTITNALRSTFQNKPDKCLIEEDDLMTVLACPNCGNQTLSICPVPVIAHCKPDCANKYQWRDSEESGCPKCSHRPHSFEMDIEGRYRHLEPCVCSCRCSSTITCSNHADCFCPKCGEPPIDYKVNGSHYCGLHHQIMIPYRCPANYLFVESSSRWNTHEFPNAKLWGDADETNDVIQSLYCPMCERLHAQWRSKNKVD